MAQLPAPGTRTEEFLAAVVNELQGLRADLAARGGEPASSDDGRVELREPDPAPAHKTATSKQGRRKS